MSLINSIQQYLPLGKRPTLPRGDTLALRPVRNRVVTWERPDEAEPGGGGIKLTVPRRQDRVGQWLGRFLAFPNHKTIELDEFGAEVWELCDGAHSVEQLVTHTCRKYKLNRRQGEVSVIAFMKMLAQRRLLGFIPKDTVTKEKERSHGKPRTQRQRRPIRPLRRRY